MASRDLNDLHPIVREKAKNFLSLAKKKGVDLLIYCTYRSPEEQELLYFQGRLDEFSLTLAELNRKRVNLGLPPLSEIEAKRVVTYAKPWTSLHQYGLAFDCVPLVAGKPDWNNKSLYEELGKIAKEVGLDWAGSWKKFREYPHFEDRSILQNLEKLIKNL